MAEKLKTKSYKAKIVDIAYKNDVAIVSVEVKDGDHVFYKPYKIARTNLVSVDAFKEQLRKDIEQSADIKSALRDLEEIKNKEMSFDYIIPESKLKQV